MKIQLPNRESRIRFAVVGCGRIAANHFASLRHHADRVELTAVCDTDSQALARAVRDTGVRGFASLDQLLNAGLADVVVLCTPSGLHPLQAISAARHGVHVVTEKPMATRWSDGLDMVRACDQAGVLLFVVKQNCRNATLQLVKSALDQRRFGRIYMVVINVFWSRNGVPAHWARSTSQC